MSSWGSAATWPFRQWISRLWLDPVLVGMLVGGHALLVWKRDWPGLMDGVAVSSRPMFYGASAFVLSLIGTIGSLSVAQYLSAKGDRAKELKQQHPDVLGRSWKVIFGATLTGSVLFLSAYRADMAGGKSTHGSIGAWLFEIGAVLVLVAVARLFALFSQLVDLIVLDETDPLKFDFDLNPDFFSDPQTGRAKQDH